MIAKVRLAIEAAKFIKKNWKPILIALLILTILPIMFLSALLGSMFSFASWEDEAPEYIEPYKTIANQENLNWTHLLAIDLGRNRLDQESLDASAMKSIFVYMDTEEYPVYKTRIDKVCYNAAGRIVSEDSKDKLFCNTNTVETDEVDYYDEREIRVVRTFAEAMDYLNLDEEQREMAQNSLLMLMGEEMDGDHGDDVKGYHLTGWTPCLNVTIITSGFGTRIDPITGIQKHHKGIDLGCRMDTPVLSYQDGTVVEVLKESQSGGYGNMVSVKHEDGMITRYAHLNSFAVKKFDKVSKDDVIGYSGSTGQSTGPHLHFEMKYDDFINPLGILTYEKRG